MEELLKALQAEDAYLVRKLSNELFQTKQGKPNKPAINYFERYAPCRITCDRDLDFVGGQINYNGTIYSFG